METNYIREFIMLAECGSSYVAAEKLYISQSTLLRHVQSIEEEFDLPLFERNHKGFVLNAQGEIFLPYARQIVSLRDRCFSALHKEDVDNNVVRLCAEGKIIDLMIDFRKRFPSYYIDYYQAANVEEALYEGKIEIAFLTNLTPRNADRFLRIKYAAEEVLVMLYEGHPLCEKDSVTMEELQAEDLIVLTTDETMDAHFYGRIGSREGRPRIVASVPTGQDLVRAVREKLGITLIHGKSLSIPPAPGLCIRPLNPAIEYELNIYYRNDLPLSKASEAFVIFAKKWIAEHHDVNQSLIE